MKSFLKLIRIRQWVKNCFVFAPLVFAGLVSSETAVAQAVIAFAYFSLAASAVYIFNDIMDLEFDQSHPVKSKSRPLAAGEIPVFIAWILLALFTLLSLTSYFWNAGFFAVIAGYLLINLAYSSYLKNVPVIEIFTVASGFAFRVYAGALAIGVPLSHWMSITVFALALFLTSTKRVREVKDRSGELTRPVLKKYSVAVLEQFVQISAMASIVFYGLFVLTARVELSLTVPLVLFGFFRYMLITDKADSGESPTDTVLSDWTMLITVLSWIILSTFLIGQ